MMRNNAIIIVAILMALFGSFMIVGNMPVTIEDFEGNLTIHGNLNVTGTGEFGGDVDMNLNYILYMPMETWLHMCLDPGVVNVEISAIPDSIHTQDLHYYMIMISLDAAPGGGKIVNVSISDGTNYLYNWVGGADTFGFNTTGAFDLDVSAETLTISYSQTAGGASEEACIMFHWYYKENE